MFRFAPLLVVLFFTAPAQLVASQLTTAPQSTERSIARPMIQPAFRHVGARLHRHVDRFADSAPRARRPVRMHFRHGVR